MIMRMWMKRIVNDVKAVHFEVTDEAMLKN